MEGIGKAQLRPNLQGVLHALMMFALFSVLVGCATPARGVVAMRVDKRQAHASVGPQDIKVGDAIQIYENRCSRHSCKRVDKGVGKVTDRINPDYVLIEADSDIEFKAGDFFEKAK